MMLSISWIGKMASSDEIAFIARRCESMAKSLDSSIHFNEMKFIKCNRVKPRSIVFVGFNGVACNMSKAILPFVKYMRIKDEVYGSVFMSLYSACGDHFITEYFDDIYYIVERASSYYE